jgi:hypothetical protein
MFELNSALKPLAPRNRTRSPLSPVPMQQSSDHINRPVHATCAGAHEEREPNSAECHVLAAVLHPMGVEGACFDDAPLTATEICRILHKTCATRPASEITPS